ncbi:hypothetical protein L3Q82_004178 [Scortum barcoo]|uniref:Uncharacterized protein n=1 Tax=Scortum barcoo TaxID=214431 RepID=A0ACB8VJN5_9TELE|nr:hypothetical protein L3Q82_004178 [Scortum barcoo]
MKTLERLVLAHLRPLVSSFMDPLQFAYQPDIGVDDAVIYLHFTPPSLTWKKAGSTVRIMFFDFSSAFNTIQPRLLGDKLQLAGVDHHLTSWILDYLTLTDHNGDDREYRGLIQDFADWCACGTTSRSTPGKTKELVVDFRRHRLDNTDALVKKGNSRLFLLRRLRSFGVQGPLLRTFYDSVVASAIFYGIVCWASSITDRDRRRMDKTGEEGQLCPGMTPWTQWRWWETGRMMAKLSSLLNNTSHPLQDTLTALGSSFSERLLHPRCVKERY